MFCKPWFPMLNALVLMLLFKPLDYDCDPNSSNQTILAFLGTPKPALNSLFVVFGVIANIVAS